MKRFLKNKISLCILSLFPLIGYADSIKTIRNESNVDWIIVNQREVSGFAYGHANFDSNPKNVTPACGNGSELHNGPCFLPPGATTAVSYFFKGKLVFIQGNSTVVFVTYDQKTDTSVSMKSSDARKINDNHGNLTIYRN